MATTAKDAQFLREQKLLETARKDPSKALAPRDKIRIRMRCKMCGRPRAVYRKFGICRICLRELALSGLVPGMRKASW